MYGVSVCLVGDLRQRAWCLHFFVISLAGLLRECGNGDVPTHVGRRVHSPPPTEGSGMVLSEALFVWVYECE